MASQTPGVTYEQLPPGMEPKGFTADGTDEKFGEFEDAILSGVAWALEVPKSVLKMEFSNSYSASRGEIKEFNMFLNAARNRYADTFLRIVYRSWLVAMVLNRRIAAPGLLEAWRDPMRFDEFAAWTNSNWFGAVKEAVDVVKEVNGQKLMSENGYTTNSVASRQLSGTRFNSNITRVARENKLKAAAMRPMLELEKEFGAETVQAMASAQTIHQGDIE
jgi:capsid protein